MTSTIYQEWLLDWDWELRDEGRKILLLQDNFAGHVVPDTLTNIHVENFEPNLTSHIQPNDQGIIRCFKAHYRARFFDCSVDLYDAGTTPSEIYKIDQLEAMIMAKQAWSEVDTTTIRKCWDKARILPDVNSDLQLDPLSPLVPVSSLLCPSHVPAQASESASMAESLDGPCSIIRAETLIQHALDDLEERGVLQRSNRMDLNEILNLAVESDHNIFDATDEDIYHAVMDANEVRERSGDSSDDPDTVAVKQVTTRKEALQGAMAILNYLGTWDDPFARQVEVIMGSFGRKTRALEMQGMRDDKITTYFSHK